MDASVDTVVNTDAAPVILDASVRDAAHGYASDANVRDARAQDAGIQEADMAELDASREPCDDLMFDLDDAGECPADPEPVLGRAHAAADTLDLATHTIYAQPIELPWNATLLTLGMTTTASSHRGRVYIALYADDSGVPGEYVNRTQEILLARDDDNARTPFDKTLQATMLSAGKYWIVAYAREGADHDAQIYRDPSPGDAGHYRTGARSYRTPTPGSLAKVATVEHVGQLSLWIRVRR